MLLRETKAPDAREKLPWFVWLGVGPFVILAAAALFLRAHWGLIPARFPIHWGLDGRPNGWSERTILGVYGPLMIAVALCVLLLTMGLWTWFAARPPRLRRVTLALTVAVLYLLALVFSAVALNMFLHAPLWAMVALPLLFLAVVVSIAIRAARTAPDDDRTMPRTAWKGGVFYYNPADPALFVPKRYGIGYTLNFANRWAWMFVAVLVAILVAVPLLK